MKNQTSNFAIPSMEDFINILDNMIPAEIQESINADILNAKKDKGEAFDWVDIINLQEKARVFTIKDKISSTHKWSRVYCIDSEGYRNDAFWCETCDMKASVFEHTNTISIISKVRDDKPTYTTHNQYLMFTCEQVRALKEGCKQQCFDCGIGDVAQTKSCRMAEC